MSYEQVAVGIQAAVELFYQPFLFGFVEVHHHVAAKNDVIALRKVFSFQVVKVEVHHFFQRFLDRVAVRDLSKYRSRKP